MKMIWWGNVSRRQDAGELLDMVDQIHEYAVTTHRQFVAYHLEAWKKFEEARRDLRLHKLSSASSLPALAQLEEEEEKEEKEKEENKEEDWFSIKLNGVNVRKILKDRRKPGSLLTDDDVNRATLEANLKSSEAKRLCLIRDMPEV
jgi:hypothetical protein